MNYQTLLLTDKSVPHNCIQKAAKFCGLDEVSNRLANLIYEDEITPKEAEALIKGMQKFGYTKTMVDLDADPLDEDMEYDHGRPLKD